LAAVRSAALAFRSAWRSARLSTSGTTGIGVTAGRSLATGVPAAGVGVVVVADLACGAALGFAAGLEAGFAVGLLAGLLAGLLVGGGGGASERPVGTSLGIGGRTLPLPDPLPELLPEPLLDAGRFTGMATVSSR
jgi:hypothetical protein